MKVVCNTNNNNNCTQALINTTVTTTCIQKISTEWLLVINVCKQIGWNLFFVCIYGIYVLYVLHPHL